MKLGQVQRFAAAAAAFAVLAATPEVQAAPGKKDKAKAEPEAASEPEAAPEPEPEPEPELEVSADADLERDAAKPSAGMKGRFGLGGTRSLSGVNAISARYYATDKLSIGALIGAATYSYKEPDDNGDYNATRTVGLLGAGVQTFYWPVQGDRSKYISADFGVGFRGLVYVGFGADDDENPETLEGPLEIDLELPLTTHVFIGDSVAITPEFGLVARIVPGNREPDEQDNSDTNPGSGAGGRLGGDDGPGLGFELGEHGGLFFGLSITYFFGSKNKGGKKKGKK
ncbi:hypothetical protein G6O69_16280 [Pseudenhygromyxa sp. WMMC2535]|uniref:hypothetical protein n=1 Tax=Pseudenhygromyxa sp. WMMC2535 TaxID=2712867 RepID=UPI0015553669|nr:hypothetical protein [Pseudenhygromyxa sp. WMMC2535]NVB39401.1 hypothetical protein [Pseudenhygromyxa sp. WMMC2535]